MVKKTHTQGGILFALLTSPLMWSILKMEGKIYVSFLIIVYIYGAYFGSVLPDIDMKSSYISKKVPIMYHLIGKYFKHRGFTHSLVFVMILWLFVNKICVVANGDYIVSSFFYGILIGYLSHIVLDLFTNDGVYLFAPYDKVFKLANIKTNSKKEKRVKKALELATIMAIGINCYIVIIL